MKVTVKLIGPFIYRAGFSEQEFDLPDGTTAAELLGIIKLNKHRPKIITRNGRAVVPEDTLAERDRIVISPIYSGG
jgi:sulfur carrier protein ThiS